MKIASKALGEIELAEEQIIEMPSGMIGFPALRRYALIPFANPDVPFLWWQCVDEPSICFLLIDPTLVCPDYEVALPFEEFEDIGLKSAFQGSVYVVVTVPGDPHEMTVNLMGPIVVNDSLHKAKQFVLSDPRFTTKHRVLRRETPGHACANSQTE
ncbi:MAG: flagellar assembly protein FliW [Candidatus Hydrogenedentota bacterium]|nr:MAG: flagellar assembly protein FliW [Candidatus Hydrogenedentota bacterium]